MVCQTVAQTHNKKFSCKGPNLVSEELALALFNKPAVEFAALSRLEHAGLRARNGASGGEEMLRLRVYEKLQTFVNKGLVSKAISAGVKTYLGLASLSVVLPLVAVP